MIVHVHYSVFRRPPCTPRCTPHLAAAHPAFTPHTPTQNRNFSVVSMRATNPERRYTLACRGQSHAPRTPRTPHITFHMAKNACRCFSGCRTRSHVLVANIDCRGRILGTQHAARAFTGIDQCKVAVPLRRSSSRALTGQRLAFAKGGVDDAAAQQRSQLVWRPATPPAAGIVTTTFRSAPPRARERHFADDRAAGRKTRSCSSCARARARAPAS